MPQKEASNANLSDYVYDHLIKYIKTNRLKSGAPVPSELRVSSDLGISRGIVREAFRVLKMAGIVETSKGRPPRVGRMNDEGIAQILQHALSTDQVTYEHVHDFRIAIEIRGAELAAKCRTVQDVDELKKEVGNMRAFKRDQTRLVEADIRFHETVARATGNPIFCLMGNAIRGPLRASIRIGMNGRTPEQLNQIVITHENIADAIRDRDAPGARHHMAVHFSNVWRFVSAKESDSA